MIEVTSRAVMAIRPALPFQAVRINQLVSRTLSIWVMNCTAEGFLWIGHVMYPQSVQSVRRVISRARSGSEPSRNVSRTFHLRGLLLMMLSTA